MNASARNRRWFARGLPGVLLVATFVDDPIFGTAIVAARLAFGTVGLVVAAGAFVLVSIAMASATVWALRTEPLLLSPKHRRRIASMQHRRFGRHLIPHPERPITTATAAVVFGSVAPLVVAALETDLAAGHAGRMVLVSGISYGLAFGAGYGLLGTLVGTAA